MALEIAQLQSVPKKAYGFSSRLLASLAGGIGLIVAIPLLALAVLSTRGSGDVWHHLANTVLLEYVNTSLLLMIGVGTGTLIIGTASAYLVTRYRFRGRAFFSWALLLPLAMPTYISAYAYAGLLDIAGPVQVGLRNTFALEFGDYWFPEIRSIGGTIYVFSFVLFPYVYLLTRSALVNQSPNLLRSAQLMGLSRWQRATRLTLPLLRPAMVAGVSLALMETLADFGAVSHFGINTFTTGIFRTWNGLGSTGAAAQLALSLLGFIALLVLAERFSRRRSSYELKNANSEPYQRTLTGWRELAAITALSLPVLLGFGIPASQLFVWTIEQLPATDWSQYAKLVEHSVVLACITSLIATGSALTIIYAQRTLASPLMRAVRFITGLGYALPGVVIAVGTLIPLAYIDNRLSEALEWMFNVQFGLLLTGTIATLVLAYLVRFLTVAINALEPSFLSIPRHLDWVTRTLGETHQGVLKRVHIPLLRPGLISAMLIVFVETMKELPATLVLRPFDFNTLAVRAYELASDEQLPQAALASLSIVIVGLVPVILLSRLMLNGSTHSKTPHGRVASTAQIA